MSKEEQDVIRGRSSMPHQSLRRAFTLRPAVSFKPSALSDASLEMRRHGGDILARSDEGAAHLVAVCVDWMICQHRLLQYNSYRCLLSPLIYVVDARFRQEA